MNLTLDLRVEESWKIFETLLEKHFKGDLTVERIGSGTRFTATSEEGWTLLITLHRGDCLLETVDSPEGEDYDLKGVKAVQRELPNYTKVVFETCIPESKRILGELD